MYAIRSYYGHHLWLASAVARKRFPDMAMVTSCHSTDLRQFQQCPHLRDRVLPSCQAIDRILALSRDQAKLINELYDFPSNRIDVVGGGFDQGCFALQEKEASSPRITSYNVCYTKLLRAQQAQARISQP